MSDATVGTGIHIQVNRLVDAPLPEPVEGQHLWVVLGVWRVNPSSSRYDLDTENLITVQSPACFVCARQYAPDVDPRCPGAEA